MLFRFIPRSNNTLCSMVSLRPLPADYEPTVIMLPGTCPSKGATPGSYW